MVVLLLIMVLLVLFDIVLNVAGLVMLSGGKEETWHLVKN